MKKMFKVLLFPIWLVLEVVVFVGRRRTIAICHVSRNLRG